MSYNQEKSVMRFADAIKKLAPKGWVPVGMWRFKKGEKIYDLSAADIDQHERIEREGLFVVNSN